MGTEVVKCVLDMRRHKCVYKAVIANEEKSKKMKKRTKISLRTKIYLTTVALLALTGVLYGGASFFTPATGPFHGPIGVAASQTDLFVSEYCVGLEIPTTKTSKRSTATGVSR